MTDFWLVFDLFRVCCSPAALFRCFTPALYLFYIGMVVLESVYSCLVRDFWIMACYGCDIVVVHGADVVDYQANERTFAMHDTKIKNDMITDSNS